MKAVYIYPHDIGTQVDNEEWLQFIYHMGFIGGQVWQYILVIPIHLPDK